jgi:hypothetical protein
MWVVPLLVLSVVASRRTGFLMSCLVAFEFVVVDEIVGLRVHLSLSIFDCLLSEVPAVSCA